MVRRLPLVAEHSLHLLEEPSDPIVVGSEAWYCWLAAEQHQSFAFSNQLGTFTVRRERRRQRGYWYLYHKREGKLRKAYLGKTEQMTLQRLNAVAATVVVQGDFHADADAHLPAPSSTVDRNGHPLPTPLRPRASFAGSGHSTTHTLPAQLTPLIGREQEIAVACTLLRRPEVRLLTLTGTGGTGKTRLGLQVAAQLSDLFTDGVYFVNLAPISDPELVVSSIAQTLGIREVAGKSLLEHLQEELHQKQLLLVLDNFEQVVSAAPQLVDLLSACPRLKLLVTSREVLHVRAEREFAVPPLALPDPKHLPELAALAHYAAVTLFIERAQAVKSDFQVTAANARTIAEICVRLDGLPLAIELAAARIKLLPPQALLARLGQRLQTLTGGARDAPVRQQTLRNTLDWSYHLLNADEQRLFRRISAFVGGCTLEAVEAVCEALGDERGKAFDGVASLLDKSIVQQTEQGGEEPRLVVLETIREYGLEALAASEELEVVQEAHALYYLALAEQAEPHLKGAEQGRWFTRLEQEQNNLRAALAWLLEAARKGLSNEEERQQAERALRLCAALDWFWYTRGRLREGWTALSQGLAVGAGVAASVRARALCAAADLWLTQEDLDRAQALAEAGLALFRELGDTAGIAHALETLAFFPWVKSQYAVARSQLEEAKVLFQEVGDTWSRGACLTQLARIATAHSWRRAVGSTAPWVISTASALSSICWHV